MNLTLFRWVLNIFLNCFFFLLIWIKHLLESAPQLLLSFKANISMWKLLFGAALCTLKQYLAYWSVCNIAYSARTFWMIETGSVVHRSVASEDAQHSLRQNVEVFIQRTTTIKPSKQQWSTYHYNSDQLKFSK